MTEKEKNVIIENGYENSWSFLLAVHAILDEVDEFMKGSENYQEGTFPIGLLIPAHVCLHMYMEIQLKTEYFRATGERHEKTHKLSEIYFNIPNKPSCYRGKFRSRFIKSIKRFPELRERIRILKNLTGEYGRTIEDDEIKRIEKDCRSNFSLLLYRWDHIMNNFNLRYWHENGMTPDYLFSPGTLELIMYLTDTFRDDETFFSMMEGVMPRLRMTGRMRATWEERKRS